MLALKNVRKIERNEEDVIHCGRRENVLLQRLNAVHSGLALLIAEDDKWTSVLIEGHI